MLLTLLVLVASPPTPAAEMKKGHFAKALELVDRALTAAKPKSKDARRLQKLHDQLVTKVTVFEVFTEPEGVAFTVDGESKKSPVTLDAGPHVFHFELDGFASVDRQESAVAGIRPKLTVVLERVAQPEPPPEPEPQTVLEPSAAAVSAAPGEAVSVEPLPAAPPHFSSIPYFLGGAGLVSAVTGGTLVITAELQHIHSARYLSGISVAGVGGALFLSAVLWLLVERRPGADLR